MGIIEDVMKAIERIPGWKRIASAPDEIEALKKRVEILEEKLAPATGEICPICRAPALKVTASHPHPLFLVTTRRTLQRIHLFAGKRKCRMRMGSSNF